MSKVPVETGFTKKADDFPVPEGPGKLVLIVETVSTVRGKLAKLVLTLKSKRAISDTNQGYPL